MFKNEEVEIEKVPTPAAFITLVKQLNAIAYEKEVALHCEESGTKVANLQGFLAGVREYKKVMHDNGYEFDIKYEDTTERSLSLFDDVCELRVIKSEIDEFVETQTFAHFKDKWQQVVEIKKDWLFYTSEKGRDLHYCKGWYEAMKTIDDIIKRLGRELETAEKEAASSLSFDDYDEDTGNN